MTSPSFTIIRMASPSRILILSLMAKALTNSSCHHRRRVPFVEGNVSHPKYSTTKVTKGQKINRNPTRQQNAKRRWDAACSSKRSSQRGRSYAQLHKPRVSRLAVCVADLPRSRCPRSLQNQPVGVESKPATLRCFIHIRFLDAREG